MATGREKNTGNVELLGADAPAAENLDATMKHVVDKKDDQTKTCRRLETCILRTDLESGRPCVQVLVPDRGSASGPKDYQG